MVERDLKFYSIGAEALRTHMIATAIVAQNLAELTPFDPRHAYTMGLLRPVGMMILDRLARSDIRPEDAYKPSDGSYADWETRVMNIHHPAATAAAMKKWGFAKDVFESIRGHATKVGSPSEGSVLLQVALSISSDLGFGLQGEHNRWVVNTVMLDFLSLESAAIDRAKAEAKERLDQFRKS